MNARLSMSTEALDNEIEEEVAASRTRMSRSQRKARIGGGSDVRLLKHRPKTGTGTSRRGDGGERLRNLIILLIGLSLFLISYWVWRLSRRVQHGFHGRTRRTTPTPTPGTGYKQDL